MDEVASESDMQRWIALTDAYAKQIDLVLVKRASGSRRELAALARGLSNIWERRHSTKEPISA